MTKQQQLTDDLFGNINIDDLENQLITVDAPEGTEVLDELNGNPAGRNGEPGGDKNKGKPLPEKKEEDFIIVDKVEDDNKGDDKDKDTTIKKPTDAKGGGTPDKESDSPVYLHAAALQENGVLPNFDLESIKDVEPEQAILKINEHIQLQINDSIKDGIEEYKSTIGERALNFIKSLEEGVPFEDLAENYTLEERFGNIKASELEENEELAEAVYKDYLLMKGFSDAKVKKFVDTAKANEELAQESAESLKEIQSMIVEERKQIKANAEKEKAEQQARNEKTKASIEKAVSSVKEILPGTEVTEQEKKELIKMLTVPVRYADAGDGRKIPVSKAMDLRSKDPIAYELRLNYLINKGFFDADLKNLKLETFLKKSETSATKKFIEKISGESKLKSGSPTVKSGQNGEDKEKEAFVFPQYVTT